MRVGVLLVLFGLFGCESPREGTGYLEVQIGTRRFFGEPGRIRIEPGDRVEVTLSGCAFDATRTSRDGDASSYRIHLERPCTTQLREAVNEEASFVSYMDAHRAARPDVTGKIPLGGLGRERLSLEFPLRDVVLSPVEGQLIVNPQILDLNARGTCHDPPTCAGAEELEMSIHGAVQ